VLAILVGGFASAANAVPIALEFYAQTFADFGAPALDVTARVTYESDQSPFASFTVGEGTMSLYAWSSWEATIDGVTLDFAPMTNEHLQVANNITDPFSARDRFAGHASLATPVAAGPLTVARLAFSWEQVFLQPTTVLPDALADDSLPTSSADLAGFGPAGTISVVAFDATGQGYALFGIMSSYSLGPVATAVPEPETLTLLVAGLLAGLLGRRRTSKR
jgi:hypothetical protein